jgi:hypothetical protein
LTPRIARGAIGAHPKKSARKKVVQEAPAVWAEMRGGRKGEERDLREVDMRWGRKRIREEGWAVWDLLNISNERGQGALDDHASRELNRTEEKRRDKRWSAKRRSGEERKWGEEGRGCDRA